MSQHTQTSPLVLTESSHSYLNSYLAIERFNIQTCCLVSTARETPLTIGIIVPSPLTPGSGTCWPLANMLITVLIYTPQLVFITVIVL